MLIRHSTLFLINLRGITFGVDESGEIIGFEKINYLKLERPDKVQSIPLEAAVI